VRIAPAELPSWTRAAVRIAPTELPCWTGGAGGGRGQTDDPETQGADASAPPWEMPEGYSWTGTKGNTGKQCVGARPAADLKSGDWRFSRCSEG